MKIAVIDNDAKVATIEKVDMIDFIKKVLFHSSDYMTVSNAKRYCKKMNLALEDFSDAYKSAR